MRKRSKRVKGPISALISPNEHATIMLLPRMHLELMLNQAVELKYQQSVLGIFNIAVAIAHFQENEAMQRQYQAAQDVMVQLIREERQPTAAERAFLLQCFNVADRTIGIQNKVQLVRAIEFVDRIIADGDAVQQGAS